MYCTETTQKDSTKQNKPYYFFSFFLFSIFYFYKRLYIITMELNNKIMAIEEEVKLIKTEIKTVLVDLRETMNSYENPFVNAGPPVKNAVDIAVDINHHNEEMMPANEPVNEPVNEPPESYKNPATVLAEPSGLYEDPAAVPTNEPAEPYKNRQEMAPKNNFSALEKGEVNSGDIDNIYRNKLAGGTNIDIITLTRLMNWTDNALYTIGKDKLNAIIDLYDSTGRLPKETKDVIIRIEVFSTANASPPEDKEAEMNDCIHVLCQLDKIVSGESQAPIRLPEEERELAECLEV